MWRILVVEDNDQSRELIVEMIRDMANCSTAKNGEEALVAYDDSIKENRSFDLMLLDISMPGIDGLSVLNTIRIKEQLRSIALGEEMPIIMITAYEEFFIETLNKDCEDYILKPINVEELVNKIEEKLKK